MEAITFFRLPFLIVVVGLWIYLLIALLYKYALAFSYIAVSSPSLEANKPTLKFCVLVPAHNEVVFIGRVIESLWGNNYPRDLFDIYVVADNCNDGTADIARKLGASVLVRTNPNLRGKGYAVQWGLEQIPLDKYDAVCLFDADNVLAENVLHEINNALLHGYEVVQCNNSVYNSDDSWITKIQSISRNLENRLWQQAKFKLGLSPSLKGNGMAFLVSVLERVPWTAFSISEDVEYFADLVMHDIKIAFLMDAVVYHEESRTFGEAHGQRLRWSSGKFEVAKKVGWKLFWRGIIEKKWNWADAGLFFLIPYTSLHLNLHILAIVLSFLFIGSPAFHIVFWVSMLLFCIKLLYLIIALFLSHPSVKTFYALGLAPCFLIWKAYIDLLGALGKKKNIWARGYRPKLDK